MGGPIGQAVESLDDLHALARAASSLGHTGSGRVEVFNALAQDISYSRIQLILNEDTSVVHPIGCTLPSALFGKAGARPDLLGRQIPGRRGQLFLPKPLQSAA